MPNYYGPNEIVSTTDDGSDNITMVYLSGVSEVVTKKLYEAGVTEAESDLTSLRERRMDPVVEELLAVLLKYDMKLNEPMNEPDYILNKLKFSIEDSYKKATEFRWGIKEEDLKFSDVDKALKDD